jgi:MOSC domain-containing protein YiiM
VTTTPALTGAFTATFTGRLEHVHVTGAASEPMRELAEATLVAGVGIDGDRYATRRGTYSARHHIDRQVTLIEAEVLDALVRDHDLRVAPHEHRRNLTTRGVPVAHLVGRYFRVGGCVLYGGRLNVPCRYLEQLLERPVFRPLIHRSGLNGRIVLGGTIRPGDPITPVDPAELVALVGAEAIRANEGHGLEPPPEVW